MFSSPFFLHVSSLRHPKLPVYVFIPRFLVAGFIFPWMGGCFRNARDWVGFLHVFGAAGAFSTHDFAVSCIFTMAVKCFC